ncbi:MAG: hypothetical protein R6U19_00495 [Bacteroidales bacterium]
MKTIKLFLTVAAVMLTAFLSAQSSGPDTVCVNATGVEYFVYETPGSSYSWWLSGGGTISANQDTLISVDWHGNTGTDTIYVVETNGFGCIGDTVTLPVSRQPIPVAEAGTDTTIGYCSSSTVQIGPATSNPNFSYEWMPAAGLSDSNIANPIANPSDTTTYILTVISPYGCESRDTITINVTPEPLADAGTGDTIAACAGQSTTLDATNSTATNFTYSWSPSAGLNDPGIATPEASPSTTTTYTLTITDEYGCTATDSVVVTVENPPIADAGVNDTICNGISTQLNGNASSGSGITYNWSSNPPGFSSSAADPMVSPSDTTLYTLIVTDTYGCTDTSTVSIFVVPDVTANAGSNDTICEGNSYFPGASVTNQASVSWTTSGDGSFINNNTLSPEYIPGANDIATGSVTLTLTASGTYPCTDDSDAITIIIHPKPATSPIFRY